MRKRLAVMLAAVMAVSLAGCGSTPKESSTEAAGASETQAESVATEGEENFKIGILTSTVSQAEEEYRNICKRLMGEEVPFAELRQKKGMFSRLFKRH